MLNYPPETAERFWTFVKRLPGKNACWLWTGTRQRPNDGYGLFYVGRRTVRGNLCSSIAHRVAWELAHNEHLPPPNKYDQINHMCDVRHCVRPEHLYRGTQRQNMLDREARGRNPQHGARGPRARLTPEEIAEIRMRYATGRVSQQRLAGIFGITQQQISRIIVGRNWREGTALISPQSPNEMTLAQKRNQTKLTPELVQRLRAEYAAGWWRDMMQMAREYHLPFNTIRFMIRRKTWRAVPDVLAA
jgi:hypothetical protein